MAARRACNSAPRRSASMEARVSVSSLCSISLSATTPLASVSCARYTSAMPPRPSLRRISYLPSLRPAGLLQPLADTVKMLTKEDWIPPFADRTLFILAPAIIIVSVLLAFVIVPVTRTFVVADLNIGLLFFLAMSSLGVYSVALAGWSSASKYSVIGGLRAAAQMMSYEVFMGLALTGVVLLSGSFDLNRIVEGQRGLWYI